MNSIYAQTSLTVFFLSAWLFAQPLRPAGAGDYYIYQLPDGKLVISNSPPPPGSKVIKKETLPETPDQELADSRARQEQAAVDNRVANLERGLGELSDNLRVQLDTIGNLQRGGDTNIAVGVTQAPGIIARPLRRPFNPLPGMKNDAHPRGVVPMQPQIRPGGRAG